jgi:hypothetical protein
MMATIGTSLKCAHHPLRSSFASANVTARSLWPASIATWDRNSSVPPTINGRDRNGSDADGTLGSKGQRSRR